MYLGKEGKISLRGDSDLERTGKIEATMCIPRGGGRTVFQEEDAGYFICLKFRFHERILFFVVVVDIFIPLLVTMSSIKKIFDKHWLNG